MLHHQCTMVTLLMRTHKDVTTHSIVGTQAEWTIQWRKMHIFIDKFKRHSIPSQIVISKISLAISGVKFPGLFLVV